MTNPFEAAAKAAKSQAKNGNAKSKSTHILVEDPEVSRSIDDFVQAQMTLKQAEADKEMAVGIVRPFCRSELLRQFAEAGRKPPSSPKFRSTNGNTVTLITQDRGERYSLTPEQEQTLEALLGKPKVEKLVIEDTTFEFDNAVLNKPGVMEALGSKIGELVSEGVLAADEASGLLAAKPRKTVRKGILDDLANICGQDPDLMEATMDALGSHISCYIKA